MKLICYPIASQVSSQVSSEEFSQETPEDKNKRIRIPGGVFVEFITILIRIFRSSQGDFSSLMAYTVCECLQFLDRV